MRSIKLCLVLTAACFWTYGQARVVGDDERGLPNATTFTDIEKRRISGIGRVECPSKDGSVNFATAFHAGSRRVLVTTAHSFLDRKDSSPVDHSICSIAYYSKFGQLLERRNILHVHSRYSDKKLYKDFSNDIAIITLKEDAITPNLLSGLATDDFADVKPVTMFGFHGDLDNQKIIIKVESIAANVPLETPSVANFAVKQGIKLLSPTNLVATCYDSSHGTSGAPVFNAEGKIIGVNVGEVGIGEGPCGSKSFNLFIKFDERFAVDLASALAAAKN